MLRRVMVVMSLALLTAAPLHAQRRSNTREGFWFGFGVGGGSVGAECQGCGSDRTSGPTGQIRLGGTLSSHLLLGGEAEGWTHSETGGDETLGSGSLVMLIYPSAAGAFFLKVGVGGLTYQLSVTGFDLTATAPSGSFGLGYDVRMARKMSITPYFSAVASSAVKFKLNGVTVTGPEDITLNLVQLGVGLTWH